MSIRRALLLWLPLLMLAAVLLAGAVAPDAFLRGWFAVQRWQAGARVAHVDVDDHRIAYLEAGSGPPLVLLHGFTGMKENWLPLMAELAPHFRVIAPDLPGWGESTRIAGADYGFAAQALRANALLAALRLENATLVGHSMGGGIAAVAAAQHPPELARLVLMDAAGVEFEENAFGRAVLDGGHPFAVVSRQGLQRYLSLVFDDPPFVPWPVSRALIERRIADESFEREVLASIGRGESAFLPGHAAAAISVPTLLLWCRDDRIIDASAATLYADQITRAPTSTVLLDHCNHMPMLERTDPTAQALHTFATP